MSQVGAAIGTQDFSPPPVSIGNALDSPINFIVKAGPTAMRLKFSIGKVQRSITTFTRIGAFFFIIQQFTRKRAFSALVQDHLGFFWCQRIVFHAVRSEEHTSELQSLMR